MATNVDYIKYVCQQLADVGDLRYRKMFGEYMVYVNDEPVLTVCDNTVYVKILDVISELMQNAETGFPYEGAKEHYILDIDDIKLSRKVVTELEKITPVPKKKKAKKKSISDIHIPIKI